ncbi:DUF7260 family protein [Natronomonas sp.]|uniref:DUF7260 family protein n=1 Tax=Natronomonas sp. TaxID=2184060 RepID=UPI002FC2C991
MGVTSTRGVEAERRLADAATELEREHRRATDEIDALRRFERRVRALDTETPQRKTAGPTLAAASFDDGPSGSDALGRVREAYESTVMAVSHYGEEYDDTYAESLAGEFDAHVAIALTEGSAFDERCKTTLLAAVTESVTARRSLLAAVDEESESLSAATDELRSVAERLDALSERSLVGESFGDLDAYRAQLDQLETNCESVLQRRQRSVFDQRRAAWLPNDAPDVAKYLYQNLEDDYPVMAVIADLLERIDARRRQIEHAMTFCHA